MKTPFLVQRLISRKTESGFNIKPGIGRNGGNRNLIKYFCEFDYMGSAEFESGAIPKWFVGMANRAFSNKLSRWIVYYGKIKFYVIGEAELKKEITEQIEMLILNQYMLKERSQINDYIEGYKYNRVNGWLPLENPYIFSADEKMINHFCMFWGVK